MTKTVPFLGLLSAVAIWAWACTDDTAATGAPDGGVADAPSAAPTTSSTAPLADGAPPEGGAPPDDECASVDAAAPASDFGNPNAAGPVDAGRYGNVPFPAENPYTHEKAILGKILFWEEQMSSDDTVACGTCHHPSAGGSDPRAVNARHPGADGQFGTLDDVHGAQGIVRCDDSSGTVSRKVDSIFDASVQVTRRKPPTYLDAMFATALFWDGRATNDFVDPEAPGSTVIADGGALESQSVKPPMNDVEMACENRSWQKLEAKLAAAKPLAKAKNLPPDMAAAVCNSKTYPELFRAAFGSTDITAARIAMALATHERTLISNQTPYDKDLAGDVNALTAAQKHGRDVYFGLNGGTNAFCVRCHAPPLFGFQGVGQAFADLGFENDAGIAFDRGRAEFTDAGTDVGWFRTATLRNVGLREAAGLLHNGNGVGATLQDLINGYNNPPQSNYNTSPQMLSTFALNLTAQEQADLIDFLRNGLTDPRVQNEQFPFDRPKLGSEN